MTSNKEAVQAAQLSNTINTIVSKLDELSTARDTWQNTEYLTATESLYNLLARTYSVYEQHFVNVDDKDRVTIRKELISKLEADSVKVNNRSSTLSLLIRYVFKSDRQRVMRYRYAVEAAKSQGVTAQDLANWLRISGGIDAVMKISNATPTSIAAKAELSNTTQALLNELRERASKPLATVKIDNFTAMYRSVLIAEPDIDGSFKIIEVVTDISDALFDQLVRSSARNKIKEQADIAATSSEAKMFEDKANEPVDQLQQAA